MIPEPANEQMTRRRSVQVVLVFSLFSMLAYINIGWDRTAVKSVVLLDLKNTTFKTRSSNHTLTNDPLWNTQRRPGVKIIIILAYMHTGSTFLGSILQQIPGVYYEYETLRSLQQDSRNKATVIYMNGSERHPEGDQIERTIATDAVSKLISCQHAELDISTLSRYYFSLNSSMMRDLADYYRCLNVRQSFSRPAWHQTVGLNSSLSSHSRLPFNHFQIQNRRRSPHAKNQTQPLLPRLVPLRRQSMTSPPTHLRPRIQTCLPLMTDRCLKSSARSFKFIRMSMNVAERLLKNFPDIKIIHLTRDPRAMLDSQVRKNDNNARYFGSFVKTSTDMCARMKRDLDLLKPLKETYPESFHSLQYENFANSPIEESEKLLNFLGFELTIPLKSYLESKTITAKTNSSERSTVWRNHISAQHLNVIDLKCDKVYSELGYIKYPSISDIRNLSNPTTISRRYF